MLLRLALVSLLVGGAAIAATETSEEREVFRAATSDISSDTCVWSRTIDPGFGEIDEGRDALPGVRQDFTSRNQEPIALDADFAGIPPPTIVDASSAPGLVDARGHADIDAAWRGLIENFPSCRGIMALSRPGFDRSHRHAVVYISDHCGPALCGDGRVVALVNTNGAWRVTGNRFVWEE